MTITKSPVPMTGRYKTCRLESPDSDTVQSQSAAFDADQDVFVIQYAINN